MKNKIGVSLISLVIAVIVLSILAGVAIISMNNSDIRGKSKEAAFKTSLANYKDECDTYINTQMGKDIDFDETDLQATSSNIKNIVKSMKDEDTVNFNIINGELVYVGSNEKEKTWAESLGIGSKCTLTKNLTNLSISNEIIIKGKPYSAKLQLTQQTSVLPTSIIITMNGSTIISGSDYTYDSSNGNINISNITGDVTIEASAVIQ